MKNSRAAQESGVLCVQLAEQRPPGLLAKLETIVDRVHWVRGCREALQAIARRPPDAVLVLAGQGGENLWLPLGLLRELDPELPCIAVVQQAEVLAEVAAMAPGASLLLWPGHEAYLKGHLSLACEQSRRRRELRESLQLQRAVLERLQGPVLLVAHPEPRISHANASARDMGLQAGAQCPDVLLPDIFHNPPWEQSGAPADCFRNGAPFAGRSWDLYAAWLPNGELMVAATDVSARVQAENRLQQSEKRLRALVRNSAVGLYVADMEGRFQMANPALAAMLGYDSPEQLMEEVRSMDAQIYAQEGRRSEMLALLRAGEGVRDWTSEVYGRDGDLLWVQESLTPVLDENGELCGCEGSVLDVTQQRYAEQGYRSALAMLRRSLDSMSDVVVLIDLQQRVVLCNDSFAQEFRLDKEEAAGAPLGRFLLGSGVDGESRTLQQFLGSDQEYNFILRNAHQDYTYMTSMAPFHDETGEVVGAILIARNVENISSMVNTVVAADA